MTVLSTPIGLDTVGRSAFPSAERLLPAAPAVWGDGVHAALVCRQVPGRHPRRQDLPVRAGRARLVPVRARPVRHAVAAGRRPAGEPLLHHLHAADPPPPAGHHGQAPARRPRLELAARHDGARAAHRRRGPLRRLHACPAPGAEVPVPLGRERHHPRHVDDADPLRPRLRRRRAVRAQRPHAVRHHLPSRARDDGGRAARPAGRPGVRAGRSPRELGRAARAAERRDAAGCSRRTSPSASSSAAGRRRTWPPSAGCSATCGFDLRNYHEESFSFEDLRRVGPRRRATSPRTPRGRGRTRSSLARSGRTFPCAEDEKVLDAAFRAGLHSPVLLRAGTVRHLQDDAALRHRRHAAPGRHPAAGDRRRTRS